MDRHYQSLEKQARNAGIRDKDWNTFVERTQVKQVRKGILLVETGELVHSAYFCLKGLFRVFYTLSDGREYNVAFSLEDDFVTSYGAMVKKDTSPYTIEAMEDSVVIDVPYDVLKEVMDESHMWERFVRVSVERLYMRREEREYQLLCLSALQRYEAFQQKYPGLDQRIPQYQVASYLGISPVSLSRLLRT